MIRKFVKRCLLAGLLLSAPAYYTAQSADQPISAEVQAALQEIEDFTATLEKFVRWGASDLARMEAHPAALSKIADDGEQDLPRRSKANTKLIEYTLDTTRDAITVSLTEQHLNACLLEAFGKSRTQVRQPQIALQNDMIRFAVTLKTAATDLVFSCDFVPAKTNQSKLTCELHAVRVGRLPLPATTALRYYMSTNPSLPAELALDVAGNRPKLTINPMPRDAHLQLDAVSVVDGKICITLRRTREVAVAAN